MNTKEVTVPTLALIAGTRVALGVGVGLLLAECLGLQARRAAGLALLTVGALTTIPLLAQVLGGNQHEKAAELADQGDPISPYITAAAEGGAL